MSKPYRGGPVTGPAPDKWKQGKRESDPAISEATLEQQWRSLRPQDRYHYKQRVKRSEARVESGQATLREQQFAETGTFSLVHPAPEAWKQQRRDETAAANQSALTDAVLEQEWRALPKGTRAFFFQKPKGAAQRLQGARDKVATGLASKRVRNFAERGVHVHPSREAAAEAARLSLVEKNNRRSAAKLASRKLRVEGCSVAGCPLSVCTLQCIIDEDHRDVSDVVRVILVQAFKEKISSDSMNVSTDSMNVMTDSLLTPSEQADVVFVQAVEAVISLMVKSCKKSSTPHQQKWLRRRCKELIQPSNTVIIAIIHSLFQRADIAQVLQTYHRDRKHKNVSALNLQVAETEAMKTEPKCLYHHWLRTRVQLNFRALCDLNEKTDRHSVATWKQNVGCQHPLHGEMPYAALLDQTDSRLHSFLTVSHIVRNHRTKSQPTGEPLYTQHLLDLLSGEAVVHCRFCHAVYTHCENFSLQAVRPEVERAPYTVEQQNVLIHLPNNVGVRFFNAFVEATASVNWTDMREREALHKKMGALSRGTKRPRSNTVSSASGLVESDDEVTSSCDDSSSSNSSEDEL